MYLDASAVAKLFLPEQGSEELNRQLAGRQDLILSDLAVTEVVSSLSRRHREGDLTRDQLSVLQGALLELRASGQVLRVDLDPAAHREAERLLILLNIALRAADALHLALALSAESTSLLTYDHRLRSAGTAVGLVALP